MPTTTSADPSPTAPRGRFSTAWWLIGAGLLLLLALVAALAAVLLHDRAARHRHGQAQISAVASVGERELDRQLANLERELAGLAGDARHYSTRLPDQAGDLLALRIDGIGKRHPELHGLALQPQLPPQAGLQDSTGDTPSGERMRIGPPRQRDGGWALPLALPVRGAAAGEPAWVVAWLPVSALRHIAADLNVGSNGIASVMHRDGWMLAGSRDPAPPAGAPLRRTALLRERLPQAPGGVFDVTGPLDHVERIVAYRTLHDYPLVVVAGIARADTLLGWGTFTLTASALGATLVLAWGALLWVLLRARARQRQLVASLRGAGAELREARRIGCLGDWTWELDSGRVTWSEEIYRIHGLAPHTGALDIGELGGQVHPQDRARHQARMEEMLAGGTPTQVEFRIVRADGEVRWVLARGERLARGGGRGVLRGTLQDVTELALTREQLRAAQDEYRFLFEHSPLPMWVFDRESLAFLAVNETAIAKYGYSREEFLALTLLDVRPAEDVAEARAYLAADPEPDDHGKLWRHRLKDGQIIFVNNAGVPIDFGGRRASLVLIRDITEQVRADAERRRSEQRFELVTRATSDAVYDLDIDSDALWWSDSFFTLFGFSRELLVPTLQAWEELLHPADRARVAASLQAAIDDPAVSEWREEYRFLRADGSHAEVADRGFMLRDEHGRVTRMVGGMLDLTQKHRDQSDLRLLRRAVESTENGVVIVDARLDDMPVVYVNAAFERITGYRADEALGRNCRFLQGEDTQQVGRHEIRSGIAQGAEARALLRNYRKDGAEFWNDLQVNPVRDEAGVITHFVAVQNDVTERLRHEALSAHRATHDELTGLPNRTLLLDRLQQAIAAAARAGGAVGVAFIDVDNFKLINDGLGHGAGDLALRAIAARLGACVRDADTVARCGGDEFVLVTAEQAGCSGIAQVIARVEASFAEPLELAGALHYLSCSIGYCCYPQHGDDAESLLRHAEIAMYEAKQAGRNRAQQFRRQSDGVVSERLQVVSQLREALVREEFVLHFQPQFRADGAATGLEALVRWQHPTRGLLPPGRFIDICESSGLMVPLGRWVLREAVRHHALLAVHGLGHLTMSINVSALQFQSGLLQDVIAALDGQQLPRGAIEIELTESAVMADPEAAIAIMNRLDELGIGIAVDDFGTGYSSLAYLKRLPIGRLKIDQSFVRDLGIDDNDKAICATIIALARSLELRTVAEGVETAGQRDWLLANGCDELQGFLLGRPAAFSEVMAALSAAREASAAPVVS